jgi:hypothetical protein
MSDGEIEALRASFKPDPVRVLFVGESAPASGAFFYRGSTQRAHYMAQAFGAGADFLDWFKRSGCYLDDLVLHPINRHTRHERKEAHQQAIEPFSSRVRSYQPQAVVTLLVTIQPAVSEALRQAGYLGSHHVVPFPGNGQQKRFLSEMAQIIPTLPLSEGPQ